MHTFRLAVTLRALVLASVAACAAAAPADSIRFWQGLIAPPADASAPPGLPAAAKPRPLFVRLEVVPAADGAAPRVLVTAPAAGAVRKEAVEVRAADRSLAFTFEARGVSGRFRGEIDEAGTAYVGTLSISAPGQPANELPFALAPSVDPATVEGAIRWNGDLEVAGQRLPISLLVADGPGGPVGAIDIPMQGLEAFPALVERREGDAILVTLPVGVDATLELAPVEDGARLEGRFRQAGFDVPIVLAKGAGSDAPGLRRPQTPKPPFPYEVREVTVPHRFGHRLAGTLVLPPRTDAAARVPAVVFVAGSGPNDRDETIAAHKPFAVLADALARAGIASLRYDKRGVGGSTGSPDTATTFDFATDADEATEWLKRQPEIDSARVGVVGHSEGGVIAPLVARWQREQAESRDPVAFLVLLAAPGVPGRDILKRQMRAILESSGVPAPRIDEICLAQAALLDALGADGATEELMALARTLLEAQAKATAEVSGVAVPDGQVEAAIAPTIAQLRSPWMGTFLGYDPREALVTLKIPVLAMYGGLDTQVDSALSAPEIERALAVGGAPATIRTYAGLNHLFQPATTGSPEEYATIETTFDPVAMAELVAWIRATCGLDGGGGKAAP